MNEDRNVIADLDPCPADEILGLYAEGRVRDPLIAGAIEAHVAFCRACGKKVSLSKGSTPVSEEMIASFAQKLRDRQDHRNLVETQGKVTGTIWRTVPTLMVLILRSFRDWGGERVHVAEVSEKIDQALDTDFLVDSQESGLSFSCMIRSENIILTAPVMLTTPVAQLPAMLHRRIVEFCSAEDRFDYNVPLSEYVFFKDSSGKKFMRRRGVISGMPAISVNDPRVILLENSNRHLHSHLPELEFQIACELAGEEEDYDEELDS